ncbi:MAG: alpha/beta fold hydrolase [Acidobacteria bacterium]|nr:alpha/beta fold hydrolase [Acidobacteriota bacterium]
MPKSCPATVWLQRRLLVGLFIIGIALLAYLGVSLVVAETLTKPYRRPLAASPAAFQLTYENVTFPSTGDRIPLRGWFVPASGSDRVVLIVHGRNSNRTGDDGQHVPHAATLAAHGYNALLFDLRGHGESGGVRYTLGAAEQRDVLGAVAYLKNRGFAPERMGFWSHSMGAATVLLASASSPDVRTIVADSSFARLEDLLDRELPRASGLPGFFNPPILFFARTLFGADSRILNPVEVVGDLPPDSLFIIHGEADGLIPVDHARRIAAAAGAAVYDLWLVSGARHDRVSEVIPEEYEQRVLAFFDEKLRRGTVE